MNNLQCDICSKQVQYIFQLHPLREVYQIEGIIQTCDDCIYVIDKQLYKLQRKCWNGKLPIEDISKEMKEYILQIKYKKGGFTHE